MVLTVWTLIFLEERLLPYFLYWIFKHDDVFSDDSGFFPEFTLFFKKIIYKPPVLARVDFYKNHDS